MIKRLLRNMRQQPKGVRDNIALFIAGGFTAVVAFAWMYSVPMKVAERMDRIASGDTEKPGFTAIFSGFKDQVANVSEADEVAEQAPVVEREVVGEDYEVVMPGGARGTQSALPTATASTSTTTASSTQPMEYESATTTPAPRAIRIVTTNTTDASSTATSTR